MTRQEMLKKLSTISFEYLDPPSEWEDIGFTERPIWINSKGYGYLSCDDPSDCYWTGQGIELEKWTTIRTKIADGTLKCEDIEGTALVDFLDETSYSVFYEDTDLSDYLKSLLDLPETQLENIYCMRSLDGWEFFDSEEKFKEAYERDWCDYAWCDLEDEILIEWVKRLFNS